MLDGNKFVTFNLNHTYHPIDNTEISLPPHRIVPNPFIFINLKRAQLKKHNAQQSSNDYNYREIKTHSNSSESSNGVSQNSCDIDNNHSSYSSARKKSSFKSEMLNYQNSLVKEDIFNSFVENRQYVSKGFQRLVDSEPDSNCSDKYTNSLRKNDFPELNNIIVKQYSSVEQDPHDYHYDSCFPRGHLYLLKTCSVDKSSNASPSSNNASLDGSDYSGYQNYRNAPRNARERDQDLRDPIEPLDSYHSYHHPNSNHHYDHHHHHREESIKRRQFTRSLSNTDPPPDEKTGKFN